MQHAAALSGIQTPRIVSLPEYHSSAGQEVIELGESAGLFLDPWQQFGINHAFGEREDGRLSAFEVALIVSRQNGKGGEIEAAELAWLFLLDVKLTLHTAHEVKTSIEAFLRIKALIENTDALIKRCKKPREANGEQAIETLSGNRLRFLARSKGSGRGFTGHKVVLDEAYALDERHMSALFPTLTAVPDPQIWYTSSAPRAENEVLNAIMDRGAAGTSSRLLYMEFSADPDRVKRFGPADRESWAQSNPALGYRITEEFIAMEMEALPEEAFLRERLGIREDPGLGGALDLGQWRALLDDESQLQGRPSFAVDVPPDRGSAVVSVAGMRADGLHHVEVVDVRPGTEWVPARLVELKAKWRPLPFVIDKASPAGSLIADCEALGLKVESPTQQQVGAWCGDFADCVVQGTLRHPADVDMDAAVKGATKRDIGDGAFAWSRKSVTTNISYLVSATLALGGFKANKKRVFDIDKAIPRTDDQPAGEDHGDLPSPTEA